MKKIAVLFSTICLMPVLFSGVVHGTSNHSVAEEVFSSEKMSEWENDTLVKANAEKPRGDFKKMYRSAYGGWSWRDGVICITDSYASHPNFNNGHAAIVAAAPYYDSVIESDTRTGVAVSEGSWAVKYANNMVYQYGVTKTTEAQDQQAALWAAKQIGKPYNYNFFDINTRSRFYCSHLVWAAYKDTTGVDIGTWSWGFAIHPFELMESGETTLMYRNK